MCLLDRGFWADKHEVFLYFEATSLLKLSSAKLVRVFTHATFRVFSPCLFANTAAGAKLLLIFANFMPLPLGHLGARRCSFFLSSGVGDVANRPGSVGVGVLGLPHVLGLRHEGPAFASRPDHPQRRACYLVPGIYI